MTEGPLTARDVKYTFESLLNGSLVSPKSSTFQLIQSIETPDEHTIVFRLKEPFAGFLWNLTNGGIGIVPYGSGKDFQRNPVGSGPYRFVSYSHEEELLLEANLDYFGGLPRRRPHPVYGHSGLHNPGFGITKGIH